MNEDNFLLQERMRIIFYFDNKDEIITRIRNISNQLRETMLLK